MSTIVTKNSSTASAVPLAGDLVKGELAVNVTDKKLYTKDNSATVVKVVGSLGNQEANAVAITGGTVAGVAQTGGTINNTPVGATTASTVRGTTVTATTGFVGDLTGSVTGNTTGVHTGAVTGNVTGNLTGNVTATGGSSTFNNVTISGSLDMDAGTSATITGLATPVNNTDAANKIYVDTAISNLIDGAPANLDTLNEIAAALNDDANIAATLTASIATKVSKAGDSMTGALAMGTNKITGLGTPTAGTDATTKTYVDTADALKLNLAGGTMSGAIAMGSNKITGLGTPTADADATTKVYVDGILGSATSAAASASAAATSATNAANSATSSANSATASAASASSAAASFDSFDDRYLGAKSSAPSVDNDGNTLLTGALYWNSTNGELNVWSGSAWVPAALTTGAQTISGVKTFSDNPVLTSGTANGVAYLNGSKVLTTGSGFNTDGANIGVGVGATAGQRVYARTATDTGTAYYADNGVNTGFTVRFSPSTTFIGNDFNNPLVFLTNNSEQMRLTSTGLGIGTSSPGFRVDVRGSTGTLLNVSDNTQNITLGTAAGNVGFVNGASGVLGLYSSGSERARITSGGDFLVGGTSQSGTANRAAVFSANKFGLSIIDTTAQTTGVGGALNLGGNYRSAGDAQAFCRVAAAKENSTDANFAYAMTFATTPDGGTFTERARIDSSGNLLVGKTSSAFGTAGVELRSNGGIWSTVSNGGSDFNRLGTDGAIQTFWKAGTSVGSISVTATATAYNTSSDYRLKNITGPITTSGAYIDSLNPVEGTWKADGSAFVGLIAHEVQEASRTNVATGVKDGEEMQGMDYSSAEIIANLIAEVKSLRQRLAAAGI